jgi:hypothetical protein
MADTIALYKSLSPLQLEAVIQSGWRGFATEGPKQQYFYPKLHQHYAESLARQWDAVQSSAGYVVEFTMPVDFMSRYNIQTIGYAEHSEYRIPVADLAWFNSHIAGRITLVSTFRQPEKSLWQRPAMTIPSSSKAAVALSM